jgi:membrane protease subunit HflK
MPWNNQGDGGSDGNGGGPWGQQPRQRGPQPPNLEDLLRQGQDRFKSAMPSGLGGGRGLMLILLIALAIWGLSGFYRVQADEQGVVMRFGAFIEKTPPGLHYHFPMPIESVLTPKVTVIHQINIGLRAADGRTGGVRDVPAESLMLTKDENIVDIDFAVFWRIEDAADFLFNIQRQEVTIKAAAESAMREVIGNVGIEQAQTEGRLQIEIDTRERLQEILNFYGAGVAVVDINLLKSDPPGAVIDAYRDVQRARADNERLQNEADAYKNDIVPRARGEAAQITQAAEAYKEQVVAAATGDAERFNSIFAEYSKAKEVTTRRMFLETMELVLQGATKVIIDQSGGGGVVPYLPLPELQRRAEGGN